MAAKKKGAGDPVLIPRLVHEFLDDYAPTRLTKSANTIKSWRDSLSMYMEFIDWSGVSPESLSREHFERRWIDDWISWLKRERGNSNDTCNVRLAAVRRFLKYAATKDPGMLYLHAESREVERQAPNNTKVSGMTREAVAAMLAAPDTSTAIGRRDLAFLTVMYSTATRHDEVRRLAYGQLRLDGEKPFITVRGKGDKVRTCYLLPRTAAILGAYAAEALGDDPSPSDLLFPSRVTGGPMTEVAWNKRVRKHAAKAHETCPDVPLDAHCHLLRHSKASHWIEDGMNVVEVQFLLGHKQLETTARYLDVVAGTKAEAVGTLREGDEPPKKKWRNEDGTVRGACGLR